MTNEVYEVIIGILIFIIISIIFLPFLLKKVKEEETEAKQFRNSHIELLKSIDVSLKKIKEYERKSYNKEYYINYKEKE